MRSAQSAVQPVLLTDRLRSRPVECGCDARDHSFHAFRGSTGGYHASKRSAVHRLGAVRRPLEQERCTYQKQLCRADSDDRLRLDLIPVHQRGKSYSNVHALGLLEAMISCVHLKAERTLYAGRGPVRAIIARSCGSASPQSLTTQA